VIPTPKVGTFPTIVAEPATRRVAAIGASVRSLRSSVQTLTTILAGLLALTLGAGTIFLASRAGPHATLGSWSEMWAPMLVTIAAIVLCSAAFGFGAWALWQREHKMAAQLLGILAALSPLMIWKTADAANVLLDDSEPTFHPTRLVETLRNKNTDYLVLEAWDREGVELLVKTQDLVGGAQLEVGAPATIEVHQGAFGRPYAVSIKAR
jgi:hypothetical protein